MARKKKPIYGSIDEVKAACTRLGISNRLEYRASYMQDPLLPDDPRVSYGNEAWEAIGKWRGLLADQRMYQTWEQASAATRALGITIQPVYKQQYKKDKRLPRHPDVVYKSVWNERGGWRGFFGTNPYATYAEAKAAAKKLVILSHDEYRLRYDEDPRLHSAPEYFYGDVWKRGGGWPGFLDMPNRIHMSREKQRRVRAWLEQQLERRLVIRRRKRMQKAG